jgi:hypothetical protein
MRLASRQQKHKHSVMHVLHPQPKQKLKADHVVYR